MSKLVWLIPVCIFALLAFIGLVIAPYELHKQDRKKAEGEKGELNRRNAETTIQLAAAIEKNAKKKPRLYLKFQHPGREIPMFSGLTVGNYGEPAYDVRLKAQKNHDLELMFYECAMTLGTNDEHRVNLVAVQWTEGEPQRFNAYVGKQLSMLFDKLREIGAEEKITVSVHCEDHDQVPLDCEWFISRDGFGQIFCGRADTTTQRVLSPKNI